MSGWAGSQGVYPTVQSLGCHSPCLSPSQPVSGQQAEKFTTWLANGNRWTLTRGSTPSSDSLLIFIAADGACCSLGQGSRDTGSFSAAAPLEDAFLPGPSSIQNSTSPTTPTTPWITDGPTRPGSPFLDLWPHWAGSQVQPQPWG